MLIDLHTHTKCSDGLLTVEELVKKAAQKKVKVLALTDHDTVEGLPLFVNTCAKYKIQAVPGIELSTEIDEIELHIVGYIKNFYHPKLVALLKGQQKKRTDRAKLIIKKLRSLKFIITSATAQELLAQKNVGKPHLGRAILKEKANQELLKKKYNFTGGLSEFIGLFLDQPGQIGYVHKHRLNSLEAIDLIKKCGGLATLAHSDIELGKPSLAKKIIPQLVKGGLWGLEMPHVFIAHKKHLLPLAEKYKLVITYGSDTHDGKELGKKIKDTDWQKINYLVE